VGLDGMYEDWHPQDHVRWKELRLQRGLRNADRWRFDPRKDLPLKALRQTLKRQRKKMQLTEVDAVLQDMLEACQQRVPLSDVVQIQAELQGILGNAPELRQPWGRKRLWIAPDHTPPDDTLMALVLLLRQEQMLDLAPELADFVRRYLRRSLDWGDLFVTLCRRYSHPEHWQGFRQFIAHTVQGVKKEKARQAVQEATVYTAMTCPGSVPASPKPEERWSVDDTYHHLRAEAVRAGAGFPVSRRAFYDRVRRHLGVTPDATGRLWLNAEQVDQLRVWVLQKRQGEAQKAHYVEAGERKGNVNPKGAARKRLWREQRRSR